MVANVEKPSSAYLRRPRLLTGSSQGPSPFVSAVSGVGNWLEVSVTQGSLLVNGVGSFDGLELGTRRRGEWQTQDRSVADAVRFSETYVAPYEALEESLAA